MVEVLEGDGDRHLRGRCRGSQAPDEQAAEELVAGVKTLRWPLMVTFFCTAGRSALSVTLAVKVMVSPLAAEVMALRRCPLVGDIEVGSQPAAQRGTMAQHATADCQKS